MNADRIFGPKSLHTFETAELEALLARPSAPSLTERRRKRARTDETCESLGKWRLEVLRHNLEHAISEAGMRIEELPMGLPAPNPLAYPLAKSRTRLRTLHWDVLRGLLSALLPLTLCSALAYRDGEWAICAVTGTLSLVCLPLIVMTYQAQAAEVR